MPVYPYVYSYACLSTFLQCFFSLFIHTCINLLIHPSSYVSSAISWKIHRVYVKIYVSARNKLYAIKKIREIVKLSCYVAFKCCRLFYCGDNINPKMYYFIFSTLHKIFSHRREKIYYLFRIVRGKKEFENEFTRA